MTNVLLLCALVWLFVLTLLFTTVSRNLMRLEDGPRHRPAEPDDEGQLPPVVADVLRQAGFPETDDFTAAIFSPTCRVCLVQARKIGTSRFDREHTVFLLTGSRHRGVEPLRAALAATGAPVLSEPFVDDVMDALDVDDTPFAFRVVGGRVIARSYLRSAKNFRTLVGLTRNPEPRLKERR
ncbi:hypothetical protein [Actinophytocola sp.]|uniref:hypothetical protein n=1 Tax=Actinophytocola sp. TaxID=1872138 RepID=UPI0038998F86